MTLNFDFVKIYFFIKSKCQQEVSHVIVNIIATQFKLLFMLIVLRNYWVFEEI